MELTMLGTGNALVSRCFNTCFVLKNEHGCLLTDGGGGSTILTQLENTGISLCDIHHVIVTHKHIDHIMGIVWLIRVFAQSMNKGKYTGDAWFYGHDEVIALLRNLVTELLDGKQVKMLDQRIHLVVVQDAETREIIGCPVTFFDICSTKTKQYGFSIEYQSGKKLTCCGDEPCSVPGEKYAKDAQWLLHEAFCLYAEKDTYRPYEKHHSTARDAGILAERLNVKNLLLYHTEDDHLNMRKSLYSAEASSVFSGSVYVPDDLENIHIG